MRTNRLALTVAAMALAFCGCSENAWNKGVFRRSIERIEWYSGVVDVQLTNSYGELRQLAEKRDALIKRIESDKLTDAAREDLKIRRAAVLSKGQESVDELEDLVKSFRVSIDLFCNNSFASLQLDFDSYAADKLIEDMVRAKQSIRMAEKRLATIMAAWARYQEGEPLPAKP